MPMRAVFITLTQASRAPGSVSTMRRTVSRSLSSRPGAAWSTSTAAITMGLFISWLAAPSFGVRVCRLGAQGEEPALEALRSGCRCFCLRSARRVSATWVGFCSASASCAPLW
jgi:hypothetical protein